MVRVNSIFSLDCITVDSSCFELQMSNTFSTYSFHFKVAFAPCFNYSLSLSLYLIDYLQIDPVQKAIAYFQFQMISSLKPILLRPPLYLINLRLSVDWWNFAYSLKLHFKYFSTDFLNIRQLYQCLVNHIIHFLISNQESLIF